MPMGSASRHGVEPSVGSGQLKALASLLIRCRPGRGLRTWASIAVVVLLAAGCASGSTASPPSSAGVTSTPLVTASATSSTSVSASTPTPADSASPTAAMADPNDEGSGAAGASFVPKATGVLPPTSSAAPADRLPGEPDPALTPGALNPAVTQATIS